VLSCLGWSFLPLTGLWGAGGSLVLSVSEEDTDAPTIARMELRRGSAEGKVMPIRKATPAGVGAVLDRSLELALGDGTYAFRMLRGPEYRIVNGVFTLERTSNDTHSVRLPRTVHMLREGWVSGDCCVPASPHSVPLRMAAEDLHVAAVLGQVDANPIPGRERNDPVLHEPTWIREDVTHHDGLLFYGGHEIFRDELPSEALARLDPSRDQVQVAIENPFAWALPVWVASRRIDGFFLLGDWLRLDRRVIRVADGRSPASEAMNPPQAINPLAIGSSVLDIYMQLLEAGIRIAPLAGSGNEGTTTPIGYNRLYVADAPTEAEVDHHALTPVDSEAAWWDAAWAGQSVVTNGPLLRPTLAGKLPGHVFQPRSGESLQLQPELSLTTRDPVEYLEVIRNGQVHYQARLDEFARAGGKIPPLRIEESSWVMIYVVTGYSEHFRAAISAPWYIDFEGRPRVTPAAVAFFQQWLGEYEQRLMKLPTEQLGRHVPFVRSARKFWAERLQPN